MQETPEIKVEFQMTEAEYLAAARLYFFNSRNVLIRILVFWLLALTGTALFSIVLVDMFPMWVGLLIILLFQVFFLYMSLVEGPRRYFRKDGRFHDKCELVASEDSLTIKKPYQDSKLAWDLYTKVIESRDLFVLVYGSVVRMMTVVPKRAFKSTNELDQFRNLVTTHIGTYSGSKIPVTEPEYTPKSLTPPDWR